MDAEAVNLREKCGELAQRLAAQADVVVRVVCGIPQVLKGTMDS
jgi:adenosyl cobinamide kinase/adenosyl cobinamide phosphate guanylyltransferase